MLLAQTRTARVGAKMVRNLVAEVPVLTQLFLGLLQAPTQVRTHTEVCGTQLFVFRAQQTLLFTRARFRRWIHSVWPVRRPP